MSYPLRVLILEDQEADAEMMLYALRKIGFTPAWRRVQTESEFFDELSRPLDLILSDNSLPQFDATRALAQVRERGLDIPFIIVSGSIGEEQAVSLMRSGAADYLMKDRPGRLGQSILHALEQKRLRDENRTAHKALQALNEDLERRIAERTYELNEKHKQLIQAAKLAGIGELAAGIAHEINNPLNNIALFVGNAIDQLRAETAPTGMLRNLTRTMEQVKRAATIINHLRTFARNAPMSRDPVPLNEIVASAVSFVREQLRLDEIAVSVDLAPSNPVVLGSAILLEQVFVNLLSNARDAMEGAPIKAIAVKSIVRSGDSSADDSSEGAAKRSARKSNWVEVTVRDTGSGISPDDQSRIFHPFFTTKPVGQGTGLGLSITYGIIQEHQGTITVESRQNEDVGGRFEVRDSRFDVEGEGAPGFEVRGSTLEERFEGGDGTTFCIRLPLMKEGR